MDIKRNLVVPALRTLKGVLVSTNAALTFLGGISLVSSFMPQITAVFNSIIPSLAGYAGPVSLVGTLIASGTVAYGTDKIAGKLFGLVGQSQNSSDVSTEAINEISLNDKKQMSIKSSILNLFNKSQSKTEDTELTPSYVKQELVFALDDKGYLVISNEMPCSKPEKITPSQLNIVHQTMLTNENWNKVVFGGDWITSSYFISASQKEKIAMRQQWAKGHTLEEKSEETKNQNKAEVNPAETENLNPSFLEVKYKKKAFEI